ncbi:hypothetical protein DSO57_1009047 [Entomophthora muscae]|uniref:Uncharacterized protein n=1 Tax=Entomophthora muscae TaxID=34485 RepID=A0ACC2UT86_9FUNG|nr:hypothetical protein DSO57_1009047 [Entomophthora muscae]
MFFTLPGYCHLTLLTLIYFCYLPPSSSLPDETIVQNKITKRNFHVETTLPSKRTFLGLVRRSPADRSKLVKETKNDRESDEDKQYPNGNPRKPTIQLVAPLYSDQIRGSFAPIGGEIEIKWKIEPKLKSTKSLNIALIKKGAHELVFPIKTDISSKITSFKWEVGKFEGSEKNLPPLSSIGDYRLYIYENGTSYSNTTGELVPMGTVLFPFDPIDVRAIYKANHSFSNSHEFGIWMVMLLMAHFF